MKRLFVFIVLSVLSAFAPVNAQPFIELPSIFGDGMVLQANDQIALWGWCEPNTEVSVQTSWGEKALTKSEYSSRWEVILPTPGPSFDPQNITIQTRQKVTLTLKDILIGQVWLCSGQSNMNWSAASGVIDAKEAIKEPSPAIRLFTVPRKASCSPQEVAGGKWMHCESESAKWFSAVGYFFGRKLSEEIGQPVGLVNASWGGTPIEMWIRTETISQNQEMMSSWKKQSYSRREGWDAGTAYNGMLAPFQKFAFAGVIWYQGESNRGNADLYAKEFTMMIQDWRNAFGRELPFYYVQIAPFERDGGDPAGALVREQQEYVANTVAGTGMVCVSDVVDDVTSIHPRYKRPVGERLAAYALSQVYGKDIPKYKSPSYASHKVMKNRIVVSFNDAEGGLVCKGEGINGLEIGDGVSFYAAQGIIQGTEMIVWSGKVKKPVSVRYCFGSQIGNVFDSAGNPLLPFRSDNPLLAKPSDTGDKPGKTPKGTVIVSSAGSTVRNLTNGDVFFTDRNYPIADVPSSLSKMKIASHGRISGEPQTVTITSPEGGTVYLLARKHKLTAGALEGWHADPSLTVRVVNPDPSRPCILLVWSRTFAKGESVTLSSGDYPGLTVMAKNIVLE